MPYGLTETQLESIHAILASYSGVNRVILFGSRAKGNYRPGSDIDLALDAPNLTRHDIYRLLDKLDELYLPYKVDLLLIHQVTDQALLSQILETGIDLKKTGTEA